MIDDSLLPPAAILRLLSDGDVHSGQELADSMGVSRTAIWKQLAKLDALGIKLKSQAGKGYCIEGGLDLLNVNSIRCALEAESSVFKDLPINIFSLIDSTNAQVLREGMLSYLSVCLAECQTAGRGRRGRIWVSPFAKNIYLSIGMTFEAGVGALEGLSLAVGVVVAEALRELGVSDIQLKWPNDILWESRKLGGVLIEITGDPSGRCHLVVGLGLNVYPDKSMTESIGQPWVTLSEVYLELPNRNMITAALLAKLVPLLLGFESSGFLPYRERWESINAHKDKRVYLHLGHKVVSGQVKGVSETGALLLETESDGLQLFHGGEISLRLANDIGA